MGKYSIIVVVLILVIGGGYFLMKGQNSNQQAQNTQTQGGQTAQSTQQAAPSQSVTSQITAAPASGNAVMYTEDGFEPHTITIKAGQKVTWTNKDSDDLWVASNPHPTHTDYPGFDELKGMSTGGTYSFTFTKVGKWGYHNHLNPSQMGVVVVMQ